MTHPDPLLGDGYETQALRLGVDGEGAVEATLVRRAAAGGETAAVLYIHGYVDYFFQRELADFYAAHGYAFYALDLRKSGRSLRPHQTPYFVQDVAEYFEEIDAAMAIIRADGHRRILVNGHSTGGLTAAVWAHERRDAGGPDALFLNSPFLDLALPPVARELTGGLMSAVGPRYPYRIVPRGLSELYAQSIHRDHRGEWEFDLKLKPVAGVPIRAGWLHAIRQAQRRVHRGLDVRVPALVMCSTASSSPRSWDDVLMRSDSVLDANLIARRATGIGRHVTCLRIKDGMHDLVLSPGPVRRRVYSELERWLGTYFPATSDAPEAPVASRRFADPSRPA